MGFVTVLSILLFAHGLIQIFYPGFFLLIKAQGAMSPRNVRLGGIIVLPVSVILFIFDLLY